MIGRINTLVKKRDCQWPESSEGQGLSDLIWNDASDFTACTEALLSASDLLSNHSGLTN